MVLKRLLFTRKRYNMKSKFTEIQQIYRDIKRIYKKIMDLKPFENYGRNDCFHFMDEKSQGMTIFSDMVWKGHPGIQMFLNKPVNYVLLSFYKIHYVF